MTYLSQITTTPELAQYMVELGKKYKYIPDSIKDFKEANHKYPQFFPQICINDEIIKFIELRVDAILLMNHLFDK